MGTEEEKNIYIIFKIKIRPYYVCIYAYIHFIKKY